MFNYFKAISLAMGVLADLGMAMDPSSEEGSNLSQREIVLLAVKTVFRVMNSFGAQVTNTSMNDEEFSNMIKEEFQNALSGI